MIHYKKNKKQLTFFTLSLLLILTSSFAAADGPVDMIYDGLEWIIIDIPGSNNDNQFEIFIKFMLWIFVFTILFEGSKLALRNFENKSRTIISAVLATFSVLYIPVGVIKNLLITYGFILSIILYIPLIFIAYIIHKTFKDKSRTSHLMRTISYGGLGFILLSLINPIRSIASLEPIYEIGNFSILILFILAFINLFNALFSDSGGAIISKAKGLSLGGAAKAYGKFAGDPKKALRQLDKQVWEGKEEAKDAKEMETLEKWEYHTAEDMKKELNNIKKIIEKGEYKTKFGEVKENLQKLINHSKILENIEIKLRNKQKEIKQIEVNLNNTQHKLFKFEGKIDPHQVRTGLNARLKNSTLKLNKLIKVLDKEVNMSIIDFKKIISNITNIRNIFVSGMNINNSIPVIEQTINELKYLEKIDKLLINKENEILDLTEHIRKIDRELISIEKEQR